MSGPKVVRVRWLRLDALAALDDLRVIQDEWRRCLARHGVAGAERQAALDAEVAEWERRLDARHWRDVTTRVRLLAESLGQEMEEMRSAAVRRAEEARNRRRNLHAAARTMAAALAAAGQPVPAELNRVLTHALNASDQEIAGLQAVVDQALGSLRPAAPHEPSVTAEQRAFAERLRDEPAALREATAADAAYRTAGAQRDRRLDALLAEIETLDDPAAVQPFAARAAAIARENDPDRRAMLTDSLAIDASRQIAARRETEEALRLLLTARARLRRVIGAEARTLDAEIDASVSRPSLPRAQALAGSAESLAAAETGRSAAAETRRAVLEGLAGLGYEVREGMETAWAEAGRIVVRKPSQPGYGVELAAPPQGERLQMRVVAYAPAGAARDPRRDTDAETLWCADVDRLLHMLQAGGHTSEIERAVLPGAMPLKSVVDQALSQTGETGRPQSRGRRPQ